MGKNQLNLFCQKTIFFENFENIFLNFKTFVSNIPIFRILEDSAIKTLGLHFDGRKQGEALTNNFKIFDEFFS